MTEYVEKQEDWMAPNGWGQRLSVQGVRYQTVCSRRQDAPEDYCTYGLECLGECRGTWVPMDVIEDVSPSRENVLFLAERLHLGPVPPPFSGCGAGQPQWITGETGRAQRMPQKGLSGRGLSFFAGKGRNKLVHPLPLLTFFEGGGPYNGRQA